MIFSSVHPPPFISHNYTTKPLYIQPKSKGGHSIAIYHYSIKISSRGKGKPAVAAAYRAGETLTNQFDGITHDYTRKGGVVHTEILLPDNSPAEYADRATLWNAVEKIEKTKNAQLAREIEIALPAELTREQNIFLVREYAKLTAERKTLNQRYLALKDEVKEAEQIRKSVYSILRQEQREQHLHKSQDMEH